MINIQSIRNCCAPLSTTALWIFAEHHTMWVNVLVITRTNSLVGGVAVRADGGGAILVNYVKIDDNVIPLEKAYYLSRELSIWRTRNEHTSRRGESRAPVEDFQANGGGDGMVATELPSQVLAAAGEVLLANYTSVEVNLMWNRRQ
ncbi:hypothetical protein J8273_8851 [Carpediemonas membranifera]|uniref:Uncharacterized protein n=1 Tax=Carpediemonas membranifera TaxID=201153 RepID=A0A8J6DYM8_9EUKA|nr:hypothetical protein J8273_8851 [Carpediemonas membranifera]|eukprot:KAG9389558.1 hypothetical protein J8273_8851 [Carpediemonas membranifera]